MRTTVKLVGVCAGAPIVALWIGGATAWAAPSEDSSDESSTEQTDNSFSLSLSAGGFTLAQIGNHASAATTGPSVALAINHSTAEANGIGNFVFAGDGSTTIVNGNFNDARSNFNSTNRVTGNFNQVYAIPDSNTEVNGSFNRAYGLFGGNADVDADNNIAVSLCGGSAVSAQSSRITTSAPCLTG